MDEALTLKGIKENVARRKRTDKLMWFSMWVLAAVVTFGLAFFPIFYLLVERRNKHFSRQKELEELVISYLKDKGEDLKFEITNPPERNSLFWTLSTFLIFPFFFIPYFLSTDLIYHEEKQRKFFGNIIGQKNFKAQSINVKRCILLTFVTLGLGVISVSYTHLTLPTNREV